MTPAPFLRDRALAVAERLTETADAIRCGLTLDALDANTLDRAARLLAELVRGDERGQPDGHSADPGAFAGRRPPNPIPGADLRSLLQQGTARRTFDERRGGAR